MTAMLDAPRVRAIVAATATDAGEIALEVISWLLDHDDACAIEHPLGFLQCKLGEVDGQAARLHVWPEPRLRPAAPDWPVHSHLWTIHSYIICGELVNRTYDVELDPGGAQELYEVRYASSGVSERCRTGPRVRVHDATTEHWSAGQAYEIPLWTYHSTNPGVRGCVATLVHTGRRGDAPPRVVGDACGQACYSYPARVPSVEQWHAVLRQVRQEMSA